MILINVDCPVIITADHVGSDQFPNTGDDSFSYEARDLVTTGKF